MVYNGFTKGKEKEGGGNFWNNVGFTLFEGEYEGKRQLSMIDNRTGMRISFFPLQKRGSSNNASGGGGSSNDADEF